MQIKRELYFPTPIYFVDLDDANALNLFLKTRIYSWRDQDQIGISRSNVTQAGAWHSDTTINTRAEFAVFTAALAPHLETVYQENNYSRAHQPSCMNMWANINPPGGYNRSHVHPGSLWSGVYYVQTPADCGRIIFQDPRAQAHLLLPHYEPRVELPAPQWTEVFHEAIAGRLILFPSWLRHEVEPNVSTLSGPDADRISISFNYGQTLLLKPSE